MTNAIDTIEHAEVKPSKRKPMGFRIAIGLFFGVACGVMFGDACGRLQIVGDAYVGLLQMTVLPYLVLSLLGKIGRLHPDEAKSLGRAALIVLLVLWLVGIVLIVLVSGILPPVEGASFFSPPSEGSDGMSDFASRFIPTNVFHSLSSGYVPAVVVFCVLVGVALMWMPGKEPLLDFLDLAAASIGHVNTFLVRLAPAGLFALTASVAGTLRLEELARLQAYLIVATLACFVAAFGALPLLLSSLTPIRYRDFLRAAQEPLLTAVATGKLFVVLPQIVDKCELLVKQSTRDSNEDRSTTSILVPLAYPFPHLGKILVFVFISFAAWYSGRSLSPIETAGMAGTGAVSSFASPFATIPYMLDRYQLPQDLMALFLLPGFYTSRLGDIAGVVHLMVLALIVNFALQKRIKVDWRRLVVGTVGILFCLGAAGVAIRLYLVSTSTKYDLDKRFLALEIPTPYEDVIVYESGNEVPERKVTTDSTIQRVRDEGILRVGFPVDHVPYAYLNGRQQLVGMDIELIHRLAKRLRVRLEFVPYTPDSVIDQLETGEIDLAVGGLMMTPERLLRVGFTEPYQTATLAIVSPDHRRGEFATWTAQRRSAGLRLAVVYKDVAAVAQQALPDVEIVGLDSIGSYFTAPKGDLDGLIVAAEEGAAWNVLHPEYTVVVPTPVLQRPVGMAVRSTDAQWLRFMDRWLDFERMDGSLDQLRKYWVEGAGTNQTQPRWCVIRDVLHWIP